MNTIIDDAGEELLGSGDVNLIPVDTPVVTEEVQKTAATDGQAKIFANIVEGFFMAGLGVSTDFPEIRRAQ